jgi:hypothetical protein
MALSLTPPTYITFVMLLIPTPPFYIVFRTGHDYPTIQPITSRTSDQPDHCQLISDDVSIFLIYISSTITHIYLVFNSK